MSAISRVTRFIAWFPDPGNSSRDEHSRIAKLLGSSEFRLLRSEPYVIGVISPSTIVAQATTRLLDVFPGTAASARLAAANINENESLERIYQKVEASAQCFNVLEAAGKGFLLESDALGLKPVYLARTLGGSVLGSRIADLLWLFPGLANPVDTAALYELLGFWAPLMGRTLHRPIRRTLPGGRYRWTPFERLSENRGREFTPIAVEPFWFMDRAIKEIRDVAGQSLLEKTAGASSPVVLALSGGFDSRFMGALCRDQHVAVRAVTHGDRQHSETRSARAIARLLGYRLEIVPYPKDGTLRHLPEYLAVTEGTADPAAVSIMNLCHLGWEPGTSVLHGFGGDALSGGHIGDFSASDYSSREAIAEAVTRHYYGPSRPDLSGLFRPAVDLDDVRQDVFSGLRGDCPPYKAYVLWYLENRSRRYVATQCALLGQQFDTVMPFYDRRWVGIWQSIPPIGLPERAVFKRLLARYYPKLAQIPHPEEPAPITPNLRWQLARFCHQWPSHLLSAGLGHVRAQRLLTRAYWHSDIYKLSKLEAPQQRACMLSGLAKLQPYLKKGLGLELLPDYKSALAIDPQALRSMFAVARYAQGRVGATSSASDLDEEAVTCIAA